LGSLRFYTLLRHPDFKSIRISIILIASIIIIGTSGYQVLEGYGFLNAFYMTVITVGTVGFMEVEPLSATGRLFTAILILFSLGTFAYSLSAITSSIVEGQIQAFLTDFKVNTQIEKLHQHVVVCGFGRNGSQAAKRLSESQTPFVVIEQNPEICKKIAAEGNILFIEGDATDDKILERACIGKAKALITTLDKDTNNLFVVLSVRNLNSKIHIISRATEESSDKKLRIAGADNVIMPDKIGGVHMAALVSRPNLLEFIDFLTAHGQSGSTRLEEFPAITLKNKYLGKSLNDLAIQTTTGANIIGIRDNQGLFILNPNTEMVLQNGYKLFVLGDSSQLNAVKDIYLSES
jgi:voltage-gated potassium channel